MTNKGSTSQPWDQNHGELAFPNLPSGYVFAPTDEELAFHYLRNKVFGIPFQHCNVIKDIDKKEFYRIPPCFGT